MSLSENEHIVDIDIDVEPAQQPDQAQVSSSEEDFFDDNCASLEISDISDHKGGLVDDNLDDFFEQPALIVEADFELAREEEVSAKQHSPTFAHEPLPLFDCLFCTRHQNEYLRKVNHNCLVEKYQP